MFVLTIVVLLQCSPLCSRAQTTRTAAAVAWNSKSRSPRTADHAVVGTDGATRTRTRRETAARPVAQSSRRSAWRRAVAGTSTAGGGGGGDGTKAASDDGGGCKVVYMPAYVIPDGSPVDPCVTCRPRRTTPCQRRSRPCDDAVPGATKRCRCSSPAAVAATKTRHSAGPMTNLGGRD